MGFNRFKPTLKEVRWDHAIELKLIELWEEEGFNKFKFDPSKPILSIDTPPPYASGSWHVAAAAHYAQIDMVARYYKLKGYQIFFPMGIDRNGLPIEVKVEQMYNIRAREVDREYFIELCKKHLDEYEREILEVVRRMGMMADYLEPYRTDSPDFRAFTQMTFIELWNKGLIYEDDRPTIWCPVCYTTIAEAEVEYVEKEGYLYYIRFPLVEGGDVIVATTRPELIGATAALLYHPNDDRYSNLKDKHAILPLYNLTVPILPHPSVDPNFGSGIMMLSSFGDITDIRLFRELKLEPRILISKEGKMTEKAGKYCGLSVEEARSQIVSDLKRESFLVKEEAIKHRVPVCSRSKNPVEFIVTRDLYIEQMKFKEKIKELINECEFYPEFHKQLLINWIDSISIDWPITRQRYYGTEVPIWYCKKCGHPHLPNPGKYYQPWKQDAPIERCLKCGHREFVGDPRTFDTWMDSSVTVLYLSKYGIDETTFATLFPFSLRPQGIDIVRTWLYYSILKSFLHTNRVPFKKIRLSGMGLDEYGRAMHKSLGNVIPPMPILDKYGADAFRIWAASETKLGFDYRFSEKKVMAARKFLTKLWNVARFVSQFPYLSEFNVDNLQPLDLHFLLKLNELIISAKDEYETLDFFNTANNLRSFTWNVFASHYIELVKNRAYNTNNDFSPLEQSSSWFTLHATLRTILLILHPIAPFITDFIWRKLYNERGILAERFPEPLKIPYKGESKFSYVMTLNSLIWKFKKDHGLSLRYPIHKVITSDILEPFHKDIKAAHNIQSIEYVSDISVEKTVILM
ncbi:MAG: valine--tRNA ligase [Candidatus Geothermarchaeota archaeon]